MRTRPPILHALARLILAAVLLAVAESTSAHGEGGDEGAVLGSGGSGGEGTEQFVDEGFSRRMTMVRELMDGNRNGDAITQMEEMDSRGKSYNRYENAILHQTLGYAYAMAGAYPKAVAAFQECLDYKALPRDAAFAVQQNLGQLYIATEHYGKGVAVLEDWLAKAKPASVTPQLRVLLANAYFHQKAYANAAAQLRQALAAVGHPDKSWYQLAAAVDQQWGRYADMAAVLRQALAVYPREKVFWQQLAAAYRQTHDDRRAAAALALACGTGLCDERDTLYLAQLYLYLGAPLKAADLLNDGIKQGRVSGDPEHWLLLAQSWQRAREIPQAEQAYREAARLDSGSGTAAYALGQLYVQQENWDAAAAALTKALGKPGVSDPGRARLLLGIAQYSLGRKADARRSLQASLQYPGSAKEARQWLKVMGEGG